MSKMEELKRTFFDECGELLQDIETGLTDLREGTGSDDTVHAVFRAVHSVKGGAGIFGFDRLVEFAHVFETVLDQVRNEALSATTSVVDVLINSSDVLSDFVAMARAGEASPPGFGDECREALQQLIGADGDGAAGHGDDAMADFAGIDFVPVRIDDFGDTGGAPADDGRKSYAITFRPKPEMLKKANEPLYILRELRKLGDLELVAETDGLPPLTELQPDYPYIGWTGTLRTASTREEIDDVFAFVVGDCELAIEEIQTQPEIVPETEATLVPAEDSSQSLLPPPPFESSAEENPARRQAGGRAARCGQDEPGRHQAERHHGAGRSRQDRPRSQSRRRARHRAGAARPGRPGALGRRQWAPVSDSRGGGPPHSRAEGQRHVDADAAGLFGVPAHAAAGPRALDEDRQEGSARDVGREHRSRPDHHRAAERSADAYHPQFGRSRHRGAGRSAGGRQERGRHGLPCRRTSRRQDRHRDQRRWSRHRSGARAQEGPR